MPLGRQAPSATASYVETAMSALTLLQKASPLGSGAVAYQVTVAPWAGPPLQLRVLNAHGADASFDAVA